MWTVRLPFWEKRFGQRVHPKGFSPVWIRKCTNMASYELHVKWQTPHFPSCSLRLCWTKSFFSRKFFPQIPHHNGFSLEWSFLWVAWFVFLSFFFFLPEPIIHHTLIFYFFITTSKQNILYFLWFYYLLYMYTVYKEKKCCGKIILALPLLLLRRKTTATLYHHYHLINHHTHTAFKKIRKRSCQIKYIPTLCDTRATRKLKNILRFSSFQRDESPHSPLSTCTWIFLQWYLPKMD